MHRPSTPPTPPASRLPTVPSPSSSGWWRVLCALCVGVLGWLPLCASQCNPCKEGGCGGLNLAANYTSKQHDAGSLPFYHFNACGDNDQCAPGQMCKQFEYGGTWTSLGGDPVWTLTDNNDASQGATLLLSGGSDTDSGCSSTSASIAFICGEGYDIFNVNTQGSSGNCLWTFTFNAQDICSIPPGTGGLNGGGSGAASQGLSGGSIFLILFFVGAFVYLVGGVLFNKYRRGLSGAELIPNVTFWRDLPGLVKDGCVFSFNKTRALCGGARTGSLASKGSGSTYETI